MENADDDLTRLLSSLSGEDYCYLTTKGRVSGRPHEIEIWFGMHGKSLYLLSGGGGESDWVKNLLKEPSVAVRIAKHIHRTLPVSNEEEIPQPLYAGGKI